MKKLIFALLIIFSLLLLVGCAGDGEEGDTPPKKGEVVTLNVYNWGEYISDGFQGSMDTNAEFEKYFNENLSSNTAE